MEGKGGGVGQEEEEHGRCGETEGVTKEWEGPDE